MQNQYRDHNNYKDFGGNGLETPAEWPQAHYPGWTSQGKTNVANSRRSDIEW